MNIILDVDDVVLAWHEAYAKRYKIPVPTSWIPYDVIKPHLEELRKDRLFWLTLPLKFMPNFTPKAYVSARGVPVDWTRKAMQLRKIPGRTNIHHVHWGESKIRLLKHLKCDIFIDDKYETFLECHKNGVFCLLMDSIQNRQHKTKLRIHSLKLKEIMSKYDLWQKSQ